MAHFTFLSSSIWKWFFVNILIYYILMVITFKKTHLWYDNYQTLQMAHKPIPTTWNHNVECMYFYCLISCDIHFFVQIYSNITAYEIKSAGFLTFDFFVFWLTIICKNIVKIIFSIDMVKIQTRLPWKIIQCDNNFGPP
jgi:hypothetical protein